MLMLFTIHQSKKPTKRSTVCLEGPVGAIGFASSAHSLNKIASLLYFAPLASRTHDYELLLQFCRGYKATLAHAHVKTRPQGSGFYMEGPVGLEPTTPCLKGRCSNQLSYGPLNGTNLRFFPSPSRRSRVAKRPSWVALFPSKGR